MSSSSLLGISTSELHLRIARSNVKDIAQLNPSEFDVRLCSCSDSRRLLFLEDWEPQRTCLVLP